jgi:hypothetical protein
VVSVRTVRSSAVSVTMTTGTQPPKASAGQGYASVRARLLGNRARNVVV